MKYNFLKEMSERGESNVKDGKSLETISEGAAGKKVLAGIGIGAATVGASFLTSPLLGYVGKWLGYGFGWVCDINPLNQHVVEFGYDNIREISADTGGAAGAVGGFILPYALVLKALIGDD